MIYIYLIKFSIPTRTGKKVDLIIYVVFLSKDPETSTELGDNQWETVSGIYADDNGMPNESIERTEEEIHRSEIDMRSITNEYTSVDASEQANHMGSNNELNSESMDFMLEVMQTVSRLSVLLAGNRLSRKAKDMIKSSIDMAYNEGCEWGV